MRQCRGGISHPAVAGFSAIASAILKSVAAIASWLCSGTRVANTAPTILSTQLQQKHIQGATVMCHLATLVCPGICSCGWRKCVGEL